MNKRLSILLVALLLSGSIFVFDLNAKSKCNSLDQRRGCCSHHDGVCGCKGGRTACCDGTLSPTCMCD